MSILIRLILAGLKVSIIINTYKTDSILTLSLALYIVMLSFRNQKNINLKIINTKKQFYNIFVKLTLIHIFSRT